MSFLHKKNFRLDTSNVVKNTWQKYSFFAVFFTNKIVKKQYSESFSEMSISRLIVGEISPTFFSLISKFHVESCSGGIISSFPKADQLLMKNNRPQVVFSENFDGRPSFVPSIILYDCSICTVQYIRDLRATCMYL